MAKWQRFPTPSFQSQAPQDRQADGTVNRLLLEQPLYAGGRIDAGIDAAEHRQTASLHQQAQIAQETAIRLINTWYEWQRQRDRLAVQQEAVEAHRQLRQQIERRAQEGVSTQIDLALASARLSQVQTDMAQTQSALSTATAQLRQLAGDQWPSLMSVGEQLSLQALPQPLPEWKALSVARDPQLAKYLAEEQAAEADIRAKKGQLMPAISLVMDRNFSGPQTGHRTWLQVSVQPGAGLSTAAGIRAALARKESAAESRRNVEQELRQALAADFASHKATVEQIGVGNLLRQSTQEVADSYARQFVAGRKSWQEVLNAVREAMQARLSVMDAQALFAQTAWRLHLRAFGLESTPGAAS